MEKLTCSTSWCKNKVKYHNNSEDSYYCRECAYSKFSSGELTKIGSASAINQIMKLYQNLSDRIRDYAKEEQLELKWKNTLDQLKGFDEEIERIKVELESSLRDGTLKELSKLEEKSLNLKCKIADSEAYWKYLLDKDMKELRLNEKKVGVSMASDTNIINDMDGTQMTEEKAKYKRNFINWINLFKLISSGSIEFEEFKTMVLNEMENIKQQQLDDSDSEDNDTDDCLDQEIKIGDELKACKNQLKDKSECLVITSYDVFNVLYKEFIGQPALFNSESNIEFHLNEEKWRNLLKSLSNFRLPQIDYYQLDYIPLDSEIVRSFMRNSIQIQNKFYFNCYYDTQIECSKIFEELKLIASKTLDYFRVEHTSFSAKEFCEIFTAAKLCKKLYFRYDLIAFGSKCDFGNDMECCKIEQIEFDYSGGEDYSNWHQNPTRFESLVAAIAKCEPLVKSLKSVDIRDCEISKTVAEEVWKRHELNEIRLLGV